MNSLFLPRRANEWPGYRRIRDGAKYSLCKVSLEDLWQTYQPYNADPHFQKEMQESSAKFNQRFWEMYLGCVLLEQGVALKKSSSKGPDICIEYGENKVWVEAVAPTRGDKDKPSSVPEMEYEELRFDPETGKACPLTGPGYCPDEGKIKLRYLSAISDKNKAIQKYICEGIISPSDPVIIALNSANIEEDWSGDVFEMAIIKKVCFGLGAESIYLQRNRETNTVEASESRYEMETTIVKSDKPIESAIFLQNQYPHISALVFSYARVGTNPGELHLIHNPFAGKNPLPRNFLPHVKECWLENIMYEGGKIVGATIVEVDRTEKDEARQL